MSRLKFSENLFLEVNELQRLVKFLADDGYKLAIKSLSKSFGIVENNGNTYFKVTNKAGTSNVVVINPGIAFDSNLNAIIMEKALEMQILNTGVNHWLVLSGSVKNTESGTVTINTDGSLSGIGTEFTKVLRGQPNFPTKVKFESNVNTGEYEVVNVVSDTSAVISGSFVNESELQYSVIGTFTPGFRPLESNKLIYEYDSYNIRIVDSADKPSVSADEFIIAGISFDEVGGMNISDERIYSMFNNPYVQQGGSSESAYKNPLASLLSVAAVGGVNAVNAISVDLELIVEHGYTITKFELVTTSTSNSFNIISGSSNYLGSGAIPDGLFNNWLLVNRTNMKYAKIDSNSNKSLFISNLDTSMILDNDNDFIVVPNFLEMEYEVKLSSNVNLPSKPFYFRASIWNVAERMKVYAFFPSVSESFSDEVTISIGYRMLDNSGKQSPFAPLAIAQFTNINGQPETLSGSSFVVNLADIEPQAKQRNYS